MDLSDPLLAIPTFVCLGLVVACVTAVLVAPARYVRPSLLVLLVTVIGYMAILLITVAGSPDLATTDDTTTQDTEDTQDSGGGSDSASPSEYPSSDGY